MTGEQGMACGIIAGWVVFFAFHAALRCVGRRRAPRDGAAEAGPGSAPARGGFGARLWPAAKILFAASLFALGFGCLFVGDYGGTAALVPLGVAIRLKYIG
jgi:hypothetical protein